MKWGSVHIFYHGELDTLLLEGVRPLLDRLDSYFFLRYWDGGPHLRLRFQPSTLEPNVVASVEDYLHEHPAPPTDLRYDYAPLLARAEGMDDFLRQPLPNNTVLPIPYRPETARYGEGESLARVEEHFTVSSRIALGLIAAGATRAQRHAAALSALALTSAATLPPLKSDALIRWWHSIRTVTDPRAANICAHLFCNRLGLSLAEESHLRGQL